MKWILDTEALDKTIVDNLKKHLKSLYETGTKEIKEHKENEQKKKEHKEKEHKEKTEDEITFKEINGWNFKLLKYIQGVIQY